MQHPQRILPSSVIAVRLSAFLVLLLFGLNTACRSSAPSNVQKGNELFAQGKYEDAALRYRKAIQIDSKFGQAYYRLALTDVKLRKGPEVYQNLTRAAELLPNDLEVKRQLAEFCLGAYLADRANRGKLYEQAKTLAAQMLAANPKSADALRLQGYLALTDRKPEAAIELLRQSAGLDPNDTAAPLSLADVLMKNGHTAEGEQVARDLIRRKPDYAPGYELLLRFYVAAGRFPDAEQLLRTRMAANPKDETPVLQLAGLLQGRQKTEEAEAVLKNLTGRLKTFPQAYLAAGDFHFASKNFTAAQHDYERGLVVNAANATNYRRRIAAVYLAQGKTKEARLALETALKADPKDLASRAAMADMLVHSQDAKDRDRGVAMYQQLIQEKPDNAGLHVALGQAYAAQRKGPLARQEFQEAARRASHSVAPFVGLAELSLEERDFGGVLRYTEQGLTVEASNPRLRFLRAVGLMESGAYTQARSDLNQLVKDDRTSLDAQVQIGLLDVAEKRYREAEDQFRKLYRPGQTDLRPLRGLAQAYLAEKQPARAVQTIQDALKQSPDSSDLAYLLVSTASAAGQLDLASQQLQELITRFPNMGELRVEMAMLESRRGQLDAGYQNLRKAQELDPQRPGIDAMLAMAEDSMGKTADASASYRRALAKDPQNAALLNNLAFLLTESGGNLDEAMQLAQKGLQVQPDDAHLLDTTAWIYIKKNQVQAAAPVLQKLTKKYPDNASYHYHYAMALLGSGDKTQARRELQVALQKHPTPSQQKQIEAALQGAA